MDIAKFQHFFSHFALTNLSCWWCLFLDLCIAFWNCFVVIYSVGLCCCLMFHMFGHRLTSFSSDTIFAFFKRPAKYCPSRAVFSGPCNAYIRMNPITCLASITDISRLQPHATSANGRSIVKFSYGVIICRNRHFCTKSFNWSVKRRFAHGWYNATMPPCSRLWSHRCTGT